MTPCDGVELELRCVVAAYIGSADHRRPPPIPLEDPDRG